MSRPLRIEFPGALYHVMNRGNAGGAIFLGDQDRMKFLSVLGEVVQDFDWICHAYCLMESHYHLLIETPQATLSSGMRQLNGLYTQTFNRTHGKTGHVFQGRFKALLVQKDNYLLELCRYIVLNPVRAGYVSAAQEWKWSSYGATSGLVKKPPFLHTDWILGQFADTLPAARRSYARFVLAGMGQESPWKEIQGGIVLGNETFLLSVRKLFQEKEDCQEIPKRERYAPRPSLADLFGKSETEAERVVEAYTCYRYTLKEIGDHLGIHYATVSRIIKQSKSGVGRVMVSRAKYKT
jgi:REP element-mobilizing transposase RayT